jgi:hypothetical protein
VPPNATTWSVVKLYKDDQNKQRRQPCKGSPLEDGRVPEQWAASEFSESGVLAMWGPGRYRVDFQDGKAQHVSGRIFEVAKPSKGGKLRPKRGAAEEPDDDDDDGIRRGLAPRGRAPAFGANGSISFVEYLAFMQQQQQEGREREERIAQRAREEAREARESDRAFMGTMVQIMSQRGGGGGDFNPDLLRRELALELREGMSGIRRALATDLGNRTPDDDDDDDNNDDGDPPKDLAEAANRIAMSALGELENKTPGMIAEALPAIINYMRSKGVIPSPKLQQQIEELNATRNGAGHA